MQVKGEIVNLTVTKGKKNLSLRLRIDDTCPRGTLDEIQKLKDTNERYILAEADNTNNTLYFNGSIHSANLAAGLAIIMHAPVAIPLVLKAVELIGKPVYVRFTTESERELMDLLTAAARLENTQPEEILCRLTTFTTKGGKVINGKRSPYDLSDSQRQVVLSKLHKALSSGTESRELSDPCA
jgi:hypothetical protein